MLSVSNYQYLLQNPFYYGLIRYGGEFYEGKHKPIISKKLFDEVQEVMKRKSKPQKVDEMKFFLYRGFFKCGECGFTITADKKIKKSGKEYIYYYCTKKNPNHQCTQNVFTREEKISAFGRKINNRFELAIAFLKDANQAEKYAQQESAQGGRDFLKKIGSNFQIQNQNISFSPRGAWQTVAKSALSASPTGEATAPQVHKTSKNSEIVNWRYLLVEIRTFFAENPDSDF